MYFVTAGDFNIYFSAIDRIRGQMVNKIMKDFSNTIYLIVLINTQNIQQTTAE